MQAKAEFFVLDEPVWPVGNTGLTGSIDDDTNSAIGDGSVINAEDQDWRVPLITYLKDPGCGVERSIWRLAFKCVLIDDELYRWTAKDLLLKCLDSDQAKVAMGEVHEVISDTHQSAPKMKWLLRRAGFYWSSMISDFFRYCKGC